MTLATEKILHQWCLVTYDIEDNAMRDRVRNKIFEMGGLPRTQSCYLIPITIRSKDEIQSWGEQTGISLVVYGLDLDVLEATNQFCNIFAVVKVIENLSFSLLILHQAM